MRNLIYKILREVENDLGDLNWAKEVIEGLPLVGNIYRAQHNDKNDWDLDIMIVEVDLDEDKVKYVTKVSDENTPYYSKGNNRSGDINFKDAQSIIGSNYWVKIPKEESLYKNFNNINESEENEFDWVEEPSNEPFHNILMRNERRRPRLMDEIRTIMFNPPVEIGSRRFNNIAYWLEDHDYYPEELKLEGRTSYIEIIKQKGTNNIRNGRWKIGPELSNQELYELSQTTKNGWNYNFWEDEFMARFYKNEMPD